MDYTKNPVYEWDDRKNKACIANRNIDFSLVVSAFDDPDRIIELDDRKDYGEERWRLLGMIDNRLYHVVFTFRSTRTSIISARKANSREVKRYGNRCL